MDLTTLISSVISMIMGGGITAIISVRATKKKAVGEADQVVSDNWANYAKTLEARMLTQEQKLAAASDEISELVTEVQQIRMALISSDAFFCSVHPCGSRNPPFGTHHTMKDNFTILNTEGNESDS